MPPKKANLKKARGASVPGSVVVANDDIRKKRKARRSQSEQPPTRTRPMKAAKKQIFYQKLGELFALLIKNV